MSVDEPLHECRNGVVADEDINDTLQRCALVHRLRREVTDRAGALAAAPLDEAITAEITALLRRHDVVAARQSLRVLRGVS